MKNKYKRESRDDPERMDLALSGEGLDEGTMQALEDHVHVSDTQEKKHLCM